MGEDNKATGMVAYLEGQPVGKIPETLPDLALAPDATAEVSPLHAALSSLSTAEIRIDPEAAARLVSSVKEAWQGILLAFEPVAEAFQEWIRSIAAEVAAHEEKEKALRWASIGNRPLYNRYRHTKKKRTRKKYAKRILAWYREEVL